MGEYTAIPWCTHTFNPWWGCENVSPGCAHCYAETLANRFYKGLWGKGHGFHFFGDKHWNEPLAWNRKAEGEGVRRRVFCASMADVFEYRDELIQPRLRLLQLVLDTPHLDWLFLTKREQEMAGFMDWYYRQEQGDLVPNLWLGVTIENARFTHRADILRETSAAIRFISAEPLLGSLLKSRDYIEQPNVGRARPAASLNLTDIDWVIAGAESGPKARPMDEEWVRELRDACLQTDLSSADEWDPERRPAFFYKQRIDGGDKVSCPVLDGKQWVEFPR